MRSLAAALLILIVMLVVLRATYAQQPLDPNSPPEAGPLTLSPGFQPDPLRIPVLITGGGGIDANSRGLGPGCVGFITATSDFRVLLTAPADFLRFIFIADAITSDATLVVRGPDGVFRCNNNANGLLNPAVDVQGAPSGDYAVWVGSLAPDAAVYGTLYLTQNALVVPGSTDVLVPPATVIPTLDAIAALTPTRAPGTYLDPQSQPIHGTASLASGFLPDPFWTLAIGGGFIPVPPLDGEPPEQSACVGFIDSAPDFELNWSGQGTRLRFHFIPAGIGEFEPNAGLVVRMPDGRFLCNRDFAPGGFTRPSVELLGPTAGTYSVWVSAETAPGDLMPGLLYITELLSTPETVTTVAAYPVASLAGPDAAGTAPAVIFDAAAPDPFRYSIPAGQIGTPAVDLVALNPDVRAPDTTLLCEGFVAAAPSALITLPLAFPFLRAFFLPDDPAQDTVMVVQMPDGRWYCGDDAAQTLNPQIDIVGNASTGLARVWIGSYEAGAPVSGTLVLTRGTASVTNPDVPSALVGLDAFDPAALMRPTQTPVPTIQIFPTSVPAVDVAPTPVSPAGTGFASALLNPTAATNYGETALVSADVPHRVQGVAGGDLDASALQSGCVGYVTANPDYRIIWPGSFSTLRFFFTGEGDATLIVLAPDGTLYCNDDAVGTVSPMIDVPAAAAGVYNVWLGSFAAGGHISGTLAITTDLNRSPLSP